MVYSTKRRLKKINQWTNYLNKTALGIKAEAERAGIIDHPASIGDNREKIISNFLSNHLPGRLAPKNNVKIFSLDGQESKEIDCAIINDISFNFLNEMRMFTNIESVASVITIKSHLDRNAIFDSLQNLASVPQLNKEVLGFHVLKPGAYSDFLQKHPTMFVFAYSAIKADTLLRHINDFYSQYPGIPKNRYPKAIIVNADYLIVHRTYEWHTTTGCPIKPNTFHISYMDPGMEGYPLAMLLHEISTYTDWLPYMTLNQYKYFMSGFFRKNESSIEEPSE